MSKAREKTAGPRCWRPEMQDWYEHMNFGRSENFLAPKLSQVEYDPFVTVRADAEAPDESPEVCEFTRLVNCVHVLARLAATRRPLIACLLRHEELPVGLVDTYNDSVAYLDDETRELLKLVQQMHPKTRAARSAADEMRGTE